ncbi:MAG: beta-N-acetylhexosaminidase [Deltaproteobacteria bacterium]|nr:beta-N-acetylhexosaminidase [Deltaproteobacteria bacterium]
MNNAITHIGKNFIVGLSGLTLTNREKELLSLLKPSGIIIFSHNIDKDDANWPNKLHLLINTAKEAIGNEHILVSIDHEGGKVHRLPPPVTHFPPARMWKEQCEGVGSCMGLELRALSINLNFAPVLDIHCEPQNQVIGNRAFSDCAEEVGDRAISFIKGMEGEGVLACAKHFPGHGATVADSHFELPVLNVPAPTIYKRELLPFRKAIQRGIHLLMTAHVLYPALDPLNPATTSSIILRDILRGELGFKGAVISDALEMNALSNISAEHLAVSTLRAGVDLLLVAKVDKQLPLEMACELGQHAMIAIDNLTLSESILTESHSHIDELMLYSQLLAKNAKYKDYPISLLWEQGRRIPQIATC